MTYLLTQADSNKQTNPDNHRREHFLLGMATVNSYWRGQHPIPIGEDKGRLLVGMTTETAYRER